MNQVNNFEERYQALNPEQRKAVDTIDGPVLVVAGPGTGKTELLGFRVANILKITDTTPESVLCLTFTEAAARNMKERLTRLIGAKTADKVPIHTFHGFGSDVIKRYGEYFFDGASAEPADELTKFALMEEVLSALPHSNSLRSFHPEQGYVYMREIMSRIGDLKQAGITPLEFKSILDENKEFIDKSSTAIAEFFEKANMRKKDVINEILELIHELVAIESEGIIKPSSSLKYQKLKDAIVENLGEAQEIAESENSTKPITEWRNKHVEKNKSGVFVLKESKRMKRHTGLAEVYKLYQDLLRERGLFDFDDMLMEVISACEKNSDLKANLQERFQYVLVDEFQDTSGVQMRMLNLLLDAPSNERKPNVLVVGDDDQSIFKFQGANIDNILGFTASYIDTEIAVLRRNYRSTQSILDTAREVVLQGKERLEVRMPDKVSKQLSAEREHTRAGQVETMEFATPDHEKIWIASEIKKRIEAGESAREIAVIAPKHAMLEELAQVLDYFKIPVAYERRRDLLKHPRMNEILKIFEYVTTLMQKDKQIADSFMPEILSFPFWGVREVDIFKISIEASKAKAPWINIMLEYPNDNVQDAAKFLLSLGRESKLKTAQEIVGAILGTNSIDFDAKKYTSKYKEYYCNDAKLAENPAEYIETIEILTKLIKTVSERKKSGQMSSEDLVNYVQLHRTHGLRLALADDVNTNIDAVNLMTVYKSKGLEFDTVFVLSCTEQNWAKSRVGDKLPLPVNLPIAAQADTVEDKIRLLYVAMTRARLDLLLTSYTSDQNGKAAERVRFLEQENLSEPPVADKDVDLLSIARMKEQLLGAKEIESDAMEVLKERVANYKLSASGLNDFLDIVNGGPRNFVEKYLLRFPTMDSPQASYGTAVHTALSDMIEEHKRTNSLPTLNFLVERFEAALKKAVMSKKE